MENDTTSGKLMNVIKKLSNQNIENVKRVEELENQPAQRVPRFTILVLVVKELAQEPPAFRPRRTQLDRLAIKPDRVLDAVSRTRLGGRLRDPVERGRGSGRHLLIGGCNRPQQRSEVESCGC